VTANVGAVVEAFVGAGVAVPCAVNEASVTFSPLNATTRAASAAALNLRNEDRMSDFPSGYKFHVA
jgi:hypothetical protein